VVDAILTGADGAIPGLKVTDTVKQVDEGVVIGTLDRSTLVTVQTPQAFRATALRVAHASGADATDDAALLERDGMRVVVVEGEVTNIKITGPADIAIAERHLTEGSIARS
jgi:2-C-methyl-D-erythritol 4-phosphate cytidylyltransferase